MRWIADLLYLLAGLAYLPIVLYQGLILGKNRRGWAERLGRVRAFDPDRRRIWIHAVSLGEINATPRLVEALKEHLTSATGGGRYEIVFSCTTDTGYERAVQLYGRDSVFRFPLDFSPVIARVLRRVKPAMIVLVELEVWYNLVTMAAARGIPVAVVNGRLTANSAGRLARLGRATRTMFSKLAWVGAQDDAIASRFIELGVPRDGIEVTSSLKWDSALVTDRVEGTDALAKALGISGKRPVWVCGSTGPGEEAMILDAYRRLCETPHNQNVEKSKSQNVEKSKSRKVKNSEGPVTTSSAHSDFDVSTFRRFDVSLVLVPRKPERFDEVARLIERSGFVCVRRSAHPDHTSTAVLPDNSVILGDTMGELRKFYSLADVVFVGRTLVSLGGSDPMEVAALGKPIVVGPHTDNFKLAVEALASADAIRMVQHSDSLSEAISTILSDASLAEGLGAKARQVVMENQGATQRTAKRLLELLGAAGA